MLSASMVRSLIKPLEVCGSIERRNHSGGYRLNSIDFSVLINLVKEGDQNAAKELIRRNLVSIINAIKPLLRYHDFEDLFQAAANGLIKSAKLYDPAKGSGFNRWVIKGMKDEIKIMLKETDRLRVSGKTFTLLRKIWDFENSYYAQFGQKPTIAEISKQLIANDPEHAFKYTELRIKNAMTAWREGKEPISFEQPVIDGKKPVLVRNVLPHPGPTPEEVALIDIEDFHILDALTPAEKRIAELYYGTAPDSPAREREQTRNDHHKEEIGKMLGLSRERVRQYVKKINFKLECLGKSRQVRPYLQWLKDEGSIQELNAQFSSVDRLLFDLTYMSWVSDRHAAQKIGKIFKRSVSEEDIRKMRADLKMKIYLFFKPRYENGCAPELIAVIDRPFWMMKFLSEVERTIVIMFLEFKITHAQICDFLGIKDKESKAHLKRARQWLLSYDFVE